MVTIPPPTSQSLNDLSRYDMGAALQKGDNILIIPTYGILIHTPVVDTDRVLITGIMSDVGICRSPDIY